MVGIVESLMHNELCKHFEGNAPMAMIEANTGVFQRKLLTAAQAAPATTREATLRVLEAARAYGEQGGA